MNNKNADELRIVGDAFYAIADSIEYPKKLTIEQIRNCEDFKNISENEALQIIDSLYKLSIITFKTFKEHEIRNVSIVCQRA